MPFESPHFEPAPIPHQRLVVSVQEAIRISGLSHTTIHDKIKTGKLRSKLVGKRRLIDRQSLVDMLTGDAA